MGDPTKARRVIVNADDFGMTEETNQAIVEAFARHSITSTTVMANMPGFEDACLLAHRHQLNSKIGVHLNLTSGKPLTTAIRECPTLCDPQGIFRPRRTLFWLSPKERRAIETEFKAQIQACIARGLWPSHLDSHHHVHTEWPVGAIAIKVARQFGIKAIRISRNCGSGISPLRKVYKFVYNLRLRMYGLANTRYFGSYKDVRQILSVTQGDVEIMVHLPGPDVGVLPISEAPGTLTTASLS